MGYLALGGPRVPSDLYLPDPDSNSSPLQDYDSPVPISGIVLFLFIIS